MGSRKSRAEKLYARRVKVRPRLDLPIAGTIVITALLVIFAVVAEPPHDGVSADLPHIFHPSPEPGALREDALLLMITRDGKTFFGTELLAGAEQLPGRVRLARTKTSESKVYIRADARVPYGPVRRALAGLQTAGIEDVAFLAEESESRVAPRP